MASYLIFLWIVRDQYNSILNRTIIISAMTFVIIIVFNLQSGNEFLARFLSITDGVVDKEIKANGGSGRIFIWKGVLELISIKPWFGYGIENLGLAFSDLYKESTIKRFTSASVIDKAHNEYLHIAIFPLWHSITYCIPYFCRIGYKKAFGEYYGANLTFFPL